MAPPLSPRKRLSAAGQLVAGAVSAACGDFPTLMRSSRPHEPAKMPLSRARTEGGASSRSLQTAPLSDSSTSKNLAKASEASEADMGGSDFASTGRTGSALLGDLVGFESQDSKETSRTASCRPAEVDARKPRSFVNRRAFQMCRWDVDIATSYAWPSREELGSGSFGTVFRVRSLSDPKKLVAVKQVTKESCDKLEELRSEISILSKLDHPQVLRFFEAYEDHRHIFIVTELCAGGDLRSCLQEVTGDVCFASHAADQIVRGLTFCHSRGICHRDLKPENIFLVRKLGDTRDTPLRLADFGLARQFEESRGREFARKLNSLKNDDSEPSVQRMMSFKGTPEYMAPEVMAVLNASVNSTRERLYYDFRCDVWSLGVIIYLILTGDAPYSLEELADFVEQGIALRELPHSEVLDGEALGFLRRCLVPRYTQRVCSADLRAEPFLRQGSVTQQLFARLDRDGSGTVDAEEMLDYLLKTGQEHETISELFSKLDLNGDGAISRDEFEKGFAVFAKGAPRGLGGHEDKAVEKLVDNVDDFMKSSHVKKAALTAAASHLGGYELFKLREIFESIDSNRDGTITVDEWQRGVLSLIGSKSSEWLQEAFLALDTDCSGELDYVEFLAAVMGARLEERRDLAWAAFKAFDQSSTGSISKADLRKVLEGDTMQGLLRSLSQESLVDGILSKAKTDHEGELSFDGFIDLLQIA